MLSPPNLGIEAKGRFRSDLDRTLLFGAISQRPRTPVTLSPSWLKQTTNNISSPLFWVSRGMKHFSKYYPSRFPSSYTLCTLITSLFSRIYPSGSHTQFTDIVHNTIHFRYYTDPPILSWNHSHKLR